MLGKIAIHFVKEVTKTLYPPPPTLREVPCAAA